MCWNDLKTIKKKKILPTNHSNKYSCLNIIRIGEEIKMLEWKQSEI